MGDGENIDICIHEGCRRYVFEDGDRLCDHHRIESLRRELMRSDRAGMEAVGEIHFLKQQLAEAERRRVKAQDFQNAANRLAERRGKQRDLWRKAARALAEHILTRWSVMHPTEIEQREESKNNAIRLYEEAKKLDARKEFDETR